MFGWPSIVRFHHPRYIYSAIPFFVLMVILLLQFYKGPSLNKKVIYFILLCFLSLNIIFVVYSVKKMEHEGNLITTAFQQLANDDVVYDKTICFVDLPHCWFRSACAQAVWMYQKKQLRKPIYQYQNFNNIDKSVLNDPNVVFVKWDMIQSKFVVFGK